LGGKGRILSVLVIENLSVSYGKAKALNGISIRVEEYQSVAVIGPNGAGKTTLLRSISGLCRGAGTIRFMGKILTGLRPYEVARLGIAHCPEGRGLFPELTVRQNMDLGAYGRNDRKEIRQDMEKAFELFPILKARQRQMANTLSGGEQQILAIAQSIMSRPYLLMLDEPSLGLALMVKEVIVGNIRSINHEGVAILLIEQDVHLAIEIASYIYLLENGRVVLEGSMGEMMDNPHIKEAYLGIS